MNKKAKAWCSVFVHVEGVPWSQSVWDSRGQRKLLVEEEVGECWAVLESRGGGGGSWRRESSLRKEHGRKRLGKCTAGVDTEERAGKGACPNRRLCEMREKGLRSQDGGTGRRGRHSWVRWRVASKWKIVQELDGETQVY